MDADRDYHEKISRLPGLPQPLDPRIEAVFADSRARGSHILNLHLLGAHAPELAEARRPLIYAIRSECKVPRIYREIAITLAALMVDCAYEVHHHEPFCIQCGLSEAATAAIGDWRNKRELFDARQLAVLGFVQEMCGAKGEVSDAAFAELAEHFSPQEIVELATCATQYYAGGLFKKAMGLMPDAPDRKPAPGKF